MSPRPQKVSDDAIYAATSRAMSHLGPGELTLAAIAAEAGLTAGALVQRFGSKRDLLLAFARQGVASSEEFIRALLQKHRSPVAALRDYAECLAHLAASPAALARNLAYLQIDLTDPDFRRLLVAQARGGRRGLHALVCAAIDAGELVGGTDASRLARTVETILSGSLMTWAHYRGGMAARWMRDDLDAVLAPYLAATSDARLATRRARRRATPHA